jgi:hypothetical protein
VLGARRRAQQFRRRVYRQCGRLLGRFLFLGAAALAAFLLLWIAMPETGRLPALGESGRQAPAEATLSERKAPAPAAG